MNIEESTKIKKMIGKLLERGLLQLSKKISNSKPKTKFQQPIHFNQLSFILWSLNDVCKKPFENIVKERTIIWLKQLKEYFTICFYSCFVEWIFLYTLKTSTPFFPYIWLWGMTHWPHNVFWICRISPLTYFCALWGNTLWNNLSF